MKSKIIIAFIAIGLLGGTAYYAYTKLKKHVEPEVKNFTIVGNWVVDTTASNTDSAFVFNKAATLQFNADSTFKSFGNNDTITNYYALNKDSLSVKRDSIFQVLAVEVKADSLITIGNGTSLLVLKRN